MVGCFPLELSTMSDLSMFFNPKSIAVAGASSNPSKGGYTIVTNIMRSWGKECLYPINPRGGELEGLKVYKSILEVPLDQLDLVVVFLPPQLVLRTLKECVEKKVLGVLIQSAGFAETGEEGKNIQEQMVELSKKHNIRIWGGNCMAFIMKGLVTTFLTIDHLPVGPLSIVGQSGYFSGAVYESLVTERGLGIRKACSIGNKTDVDEYDLLFDFGQDPEAQVCAFYLEGFKDGRRFVQLARNISKEKPIICLPGATSPVGRQAAASHTGAIISDSTPLLFRSLLENYAGIVLAEGFEDLFDLAEGFTRLPLPKGRNLAVVTITGAGGVITCDMAVKYGLNVPPLPEKVRKKVGKVFPEWMPPANPIDSYPAFIHSGINNALEVILETILSEDSFDMVVLVMASIKVVYEFDPSLIGKYTQKYRKPVVCWVMGEKEVTEDWTRTLRDSGTTTFRSLDTCVRVLAKMIQYADFKDKMKSMVP